MIPGVPYDAEIEYLESTGTQWIDTGIALNSRLMEFRLEMCVTSFTANWTRFAGCLISDTNANYNTGFRMCRSGSTDYSDVLFLNAPRAAPSSFLFSVLGTRPVALVAKNGYVAGESPIGTVTASRTATPSTATPCGRNIYLFCSNESNIARYITKNMRLFRFLVTENGSTIYDFIPVRVGQTGYMYDRVSKRLFGNNGTGSFVLGPDVAKPVMGLYGMRKFYDTTDYIQDGLVAMWDGINNTGHGHDPNAGIADLSGNGYDLVLTGSDSRGPDYFALDGKGHYTVTNGAKIISAFDSGCLECEIVASGNNGECMLSFFGSNTDGFLVRPWFYTVSSTNNRYGTRGTVGTVTKDAGFYNQPSSYIGRIVRHATRFSTPNFIVECNVTAKATGTIGTYTRSNSNMILGARASYTGVNRWSGKYYNVRLYYRALSSAEIAHNYQIDKARFNLP